MRRSSARRCPGVGSDDGPAEVSSGSVASSGAVASSRTAPGPSGASASADAGEPPGARSADRQSVDRPSADARPLTQGMREIRWIRRTGATGPRRGG
ncbi:hypothetical protein ACFFX0_28425 [Citricoccus parietis]|uniref:Uncharacterized protein n=1 Tax=Citricoccus parietis TaxID=592307 RepID=A0ABV5G7P1_9MICC